MGVALSLRDRRELEECEAVIESGLQTFLEVGTALMTIRTARLHRTTHDTFEAYCRERWGMSKTHANRLIESADVVVNVTPIGVTPASESVCRPLAPLPPAAQRAVWADAVAAAPNGKPTARDTTAAVRRMATIERRREEKTAELTAAAEAISEPRPELAGPAFDPVAAANPWHVIAGDCLEVLAAVPLRSARLVFTDPPYNQGVDYGDGADADLLPRNTYLGWCSQWIAEVRRVLTPDGSFWLLCPHEWADELGVELRRQCFHRQNWVIWYESFGVNCSGKFNRTARHLFHAVKDPKRFVFNAEAVTRPSDRQAKYGDKRAAPGGKLWDDVWGVNPLIPRVAGTHAERIPAFPTQLPLALLRPIIGCASDPGDLVLDPFSGSGTTGAAAVELGRRYLGIELSPKFAKLSRGRLAAVEKEVECA